MFHRLLKYLLEKIFYFRNKKFINNRKNVNKIIIIKGYRKLGIVYLSFNKDSDKNEEIECLEKVTIDSN